jgi:hypothetical protein
VASTTSGAEPHVATLYVVYGPQRMADEFTKYLRADEEMHPADRVVRVDAALREIQGQARRIVLVDTDYPDGAGMARRWHEVSAVAAHRNRTNGYVTDRLEFQP